MLTVLLVTVMLMNSHSYWVRITSRDHSVACDELIWRTSCISASDMGDKHKLKFPCRVTKTKCTVCVDIWCCVQFTLNCESPYKRWTQTWENRSRELSYRLTRMYDRLEGEFAALNVKGEFVNVHSAGADKHLVILNMDFTSRGDGEMRTWRSFVFFCPG